MKVPGLGRLRRTAVRAKRRLAPAPRVLLYHRVADLERDPFWLAVAPDRFAQQMNLLREKFNPLSLLALLDHLAAGTLPRNAVVVTFDDGYLDNFTAAKPVLEKYEVPATVFVAVRNLGGKTEFWWDELEQFVFAPAELPVRLELHLGRTHFEWQAKDNTAPPPGLDSWNTLQGPPPTERHRLYLELARLLKELAPASRDAALTQLADWSGFERRPRPTHVSMTPAQLAELAATGLIEIGAHTLNHPQLSALSPAEQELEISGSKRDLEALTGREIPSFAFPHGGGVDYTTQTVSITQKAGFRCACAAFPGCVRPGTDLFQLPRFFVRDWDAAEFESQLNSFAAE